MNSLMHKSKWLMVAAIFAWAMPGASMAADEASDSAREKSDGERMHKKVVVRQLSQLDSGNVYGNDGEQIGHINGIAIDANRGHIAYAVVEFDKLGDFPDKQFAVPWVSIHKKFDHKDASKISYSINVDRERLATAKNFERDKWPNMAELKEQDSYSFWKAEPYWDTHVSVRTGDTDVDIKATDDDKTKARLRGTPISPENELLLRANDLVGHKIVDRDGKEFGDLHDVMTDVHSGRAVYGIVQIDKAPDFSKDYLYPIPAQSFDIQPTGEDRAGRFANDEGAFKVVLNTSMETIKNGPKFPEREWPNMTTAWGEQVFQAYGVEPFWKERMRDQKDEKDRERKD